MEDKTVAIIVCILILGPIISYSINPFVRANINTKFCNVQMVDDATNYKTLKKVEDTCRSMIASYTSDKMMYETYINSIDPEKVGWAEQAKIRANKTASTYNNYILRNKYVWKNNIPDDIRMELEYIE
jgi:hypothetical protein